MLANARPGDLDDVIRVVDEFCYERSFMMNVGDEKGEILDAAIRGSRTEAGPRARDLLRLQRAAHGARDARRAHLYSIEFNEANAEIARRDLAHAGVDGPRQVVVGTLGDGGTTPTRSPTEHGFAPGSLDAVFIDHDKDAYLPDLELMLASGWLHAGSVARRRQRQVPGRARLPRVHARRGGQDLPHRRARDARRVPDLMKDLVLESEYLGGPGGCAPAPRGFRWTCATARGPT